MALFEESLKVWEDKLRASHTKTVDEIQPWQYDPALKAMEGCVILLQKQRKLKDAEEQDEEAERLHKTYDEGYDKVLGK
ncbi:MAG: hypothetical protein Q9217_006425 [Psora testacea]